MKKTVLITGASSGIGKETAHYFLEKGYNVVATMRNPSKLDSELRLLSGLDLVRLDVTDTSSIRKAIAFALKKYGKIDVVVNNAGYAVMGPFELSNEDQVESQFQTNVFGLMNLSREIIPVFRSQNGGTLVNVSSMAGRVSFPYYSAYNSSKWAVEGFSESLMHEVSQFGIHIKLIEPGVIKTDFYGRSMDRVGFGKKEGYLGLFERFEKNMDKHGKGLHPREVAKAIFNASNDNSEKLRYVVGSDALQLITLRKLLPERLFFRLFKFLLLK